MKYLSFLLLVVIGFKAMAQESCVQSLREARTAYQDGQIHIVPDLLAFCLNNGFSKNERQEALKLQTLAYIYMDESNKADESMLALLKTNNEFKPDLANDPEEFIQLYKTFRTNPLFRYGVKLGLNMSYGNAISSNGATNTNDAAQVGSYNNALGFHAGLSLEVPITNKITIAPDFLFVSKALEYNNTNLVPDVSQIESREVLNYFEMPLSIQIKVLDNSLNPYILVGGTGGVHLKSNMTITRTITDRQEIKENTIDITQMREQIQYGAHAGFGIKTRIGPGYFVFEAKYHHSLSNVSKQSEIYNNPILTHDYFYTDSEHSISSFSLNIMGYLFNYYKPKKRKR